MMKNKIFHLSFARIGGAGKVGFELAKEMKSIGYDANLIYLQNEKSLKDFIRYVNVFLLSIIDNFIIKKKHKLPFFSILRSYTHAKGLERIWEKDSLLHLHWIPGLANLNKILKQKNDSIKVVVTLHDMWFFTGGCHFSNGCTQYTSGCKKCPMVHSIFRPLVASQYSKKKNFFSVYNTSKITSPSNNLLAKASSSQIFKSNIQHISNPVSNDIIFPGSKISARKTINLDTDAFVVGFVAADIEDPRKNFKDALGAFKNLVATFPTANVKFIVVGDGDNKKLPGSPQIHNIPRLKDPTLLAPYFAAFDVLLLTSNDENSPLVVIDALMNNCFVIASNHGGTKELIDSNQNGYVYTDFKHLSNLLIETYESKRYKSVEFQHKVRHSANYIANKYLKLYESFE
jgi:glycosyltransferase involved in cell wall biosynthesis